MLSILLFTVINCSGQKATLYDTLPMLTTASLPKLPTYMMNIPAIDVTKVTKDTLGVRPIIDNRLNLFYKTPESVQALTISNKRIYIDSTYLQLIIQELERHGYTLVKLPKKQ